MRCGGWRIQSAVVLVGVLAVAAPPGRAQVGEAAAERLTAFKAALAASQKQLRQYEWIETTIVSLKGEERSRNQLRCYYGADGTLQKLPVASGGDSSDAGARQKGGRLRQRIVANKKEELQEYMERASSLIHHYVPPTPDNLEASKAAGKLSIRPAAGGGQVGLDFGNYLKTGDRLSLELQPATNSLVALSVASYLDGPDDAVKLDVQFGSLPDGTTYAARSTLDAPAKSVRVVVQNAGYRRLGPQ
jgi:hypothetical protein